MGWKGTVRSINASVKASQREKARINREHEKQRNIEEKNSAVRNAYLEYEQFRTYCILIISLHHECSEILNWKKISESKEPNVPKRLRAFEIKANEEINKYKPGIIDKVFKLQNKKIKALEENITIAKKKDEAVHEERMNTWKSKKHKWIDETKLAVKLLKNDPESKIKVIEKYNPFSQISQVGSEIKFSIDEKSIITSTVNVHGKKVVPSETKSILQSGKVSIKKMPKSEYNEMFQDHVCSVVLRIANEVFSLLPDEIVIVNAVDNLLNKKNRASRRNDYLISSSFTKYTLQTKP